MTQWFSKIGIRHASARDSGVIKPGQPVNSTVWFGVAENLGSIFRPGVGVNADAGFLMLEVYILKLLPILGLHEVYIQAVIDAQEINLIGIDGTLGSYARLNKVLKFFKNADF